MVTLFQQSLHPTEPRILPLLPSAKCIARALTILLISLDFMVHHYIITFWQMPSPPSPISPLWTWLANSSSGLFTIHPLIPAPEHWPLLEKNHTTVLISLTLHFLPRSQLGTQFGTTIVTFSQWVLSPSLNRNFPYFLLSANLYDPLPITLSADNLTPYVTEEKSSSQIRATSSSHHEISSLGPMTAAFLFFFPPSFIETELTHNIIYV